jgi:hypothetical protein
MLRRFWKRAKRADVHAVMGEGLLDGLEGVDGGSVPSASRITIVWRGGVGQAQRPCKYSGSPRKQR